MSHDDPSVVFIADLPAGPDFGPIDLACRFYGFRLVVASVAGPGAFPDAAPPGPLPILVVVPAAELARHPRQSWLDLQIQADRRGVPIAVIGIAADCDLDILRLFTGGAVVTSSEAGPADGLWAVAADPASTGFELRGLRLGLRPGPSYVLDCRAEPPGRVLAAVGAVEAESRPALLRLDGGKYSRYLLARLGGLGGESPSWEFRRTHFGEIAPALLLLRDAGGARCWHPSLQLANLTIDDPWLTEPYGCLSFPGLIAEMRRERFHATIGFVPWNYDRNSPETAALLRASPEYFSIAIHGNNHDRYEFYRYESRAGDNQSPKPLALQTFNIRQALVRMEAFHRLTGLDFDRVMVFPHGICPGPTLSVLKQTGFWATSNYSNVPLGEPPPADPAAALRAVNTGWEGFPALRRNYPQNLSEESIAIDLFLGNPVLFMAHQDLFFDGIDAFTPHARRVNLRQPAVRWLGLGEISRHLHLLRWRDGSCCDVRLLSRHARVGNPRSAAVEFRFAKCEPAGETIGRVTVDGREVDWTFADGEVCFAVLLAAGASSLVEIHYQFPAGEGFPELRRRGLRNHCLRLIAEFRDLTLSRSLLGRLLTRKYYRQGKHRPTLRGLFSRPAALLRKDRSGSGRS